MTKAFLTAFLAPALLASLHASASPQQAEAPSRLTLRIYNYAEAHPHILRNARRHTERVLAPAAVETAWLDCPTSPEEIPFNRSCADEPGPNHLILNLLPPSMSERYGFNRDIFGFALPTARGLPGSKISLFFKRVLDLAYHGGVGTSFENAQALILGHMMAHEVGHLLLGPGSHSATGVMSFPWNRRTLTNMERGQLRFSSLEQRRIRKAMDRRIERSLERPRRKETVRNLSLHATL
jgi:hypothetical protein